MGIAALFISSCGRNAEPTLNDRTDTFSWVLGENVALSLIKGHVVDIDNEVFLQAVRHTLQGEKQPISDSTYNMVLQYIMMQAQLKQMQSGEAAKASTDEAQEKYFAELVTTNKNVKKHSSGFYYEVLKEGRGPRPKVGSSVKFDYRSYLMLTGEPYDQTYGKCPPIEHVVGKPMFPGILEGLQLMNAGSIYRFYFPYQLAFGSSGDGGIPPYTPLIYEIELHALLD